MVHFCPKQYKKNLQLAVREKCPNTDEKNSVFGHFSRSFVYLKGFIFVYIFTDLVPFHSFITFHFKKFFSLSFNFDLQLSHPITKCIVIKFQALFVSCCYDGTLQFCHITCLSRFWGFRIKVVGWLYKYYLKLGKLCGSKWKINLNLSSLHKFCDARQTRCNKISSIPSLLLISLY